MPRKVKRGCTSSRRARGKSLIVASRKKQISIVDVEKRDNQEKT